MHCKVLPIFSLFSVYFWSFDIEELNIQTLESLKDMCYCELVQTEISIKNCIASVQPLGGTNRSFCGNVILVHMLYGILLVIYNIVLNLYMLCYAECLFTL